MVTDPHLAQVDGKWVTAKEEPYYPSWRERLFCWLGNHENRVSKKYRGTMVCFRCGRRTVGLDHY